MVAAIKQGGRKGKTQGQNKEQKWEEK